MIEVVASYCQTCWACPSQWEARLASGAYAYIRYRWGYLEVYTFETTLSDAFCKSPALELEWGDSLDGLMSDEDMRRLTSGVLDWASAELVPYTDWERLTD